MLQEIQPLAGEKIEDLQLAGLKILQKEKGFRYGMDAVLLADFARMGRRDAVADFGTGTGILPLLLYGRGKGKTLHFLTSGFLFFVLRLFFLPSLAD